MANKIHRETFFKASLEKVFEVISKADHMVQVWPSLIEVKNVENLPNGGEAFEFVYMMAGMRLNGYSEDQDLDPPHFISNKTFSGVESFQFWKLEPDDRRQGVKAVFEVEYIVPVPLLRRFAERMVVAFTEVDVDAMIKNVKYKVENL